jgi:hypothetical protein
LKSVSLAAAICYAALLPAQEMRSSVAGRVTDPSGAAVPRARVAVTNVDTNLSSQTLSNDSGRFAILFLQPGRYRLSVEAPGFKKFVQENLEIGSSEKAGIEVGLEVGQLSERITVTTESLLLNTETASRGSAVTPKQIVELPNNGRNVYQFAWAAPGLIKASRSYGSMNNIAHSNASDVSINGSFRGENESILDGVTNTQPITRNVTFMPPLQSVGEFKVQTNNYDASYGRTGGGVIAISTKSGTNALHGALFEFYRGSALSANSWEANSLGNPRTRAVNNNYGFHLDGPVWIPKLFDGRNRLFFMVSHDYTVSRGVDIESAVMPDATLRSGDLTGVPLTVYDPLTTRQQGSAFIREPFAGNRIPAARINHVSRKVLDFVPLPNLTGRAFGQQNYANFGGLGSGYHQALYKVDYRMNQKNNMYVSYGITPFDEYGDILFGRGNPAETSRSLPSSRYYYRGAFDWTSTLNAQTVLNFRGGIARYVNKRGNEDAVGFDPRRLGFADALVSQFSTLNFPRFDIGPNRYTSIGSSIWKDLNVRESSSYQANLNRNHGRHQIKLGAEFRIFNENTVAPGNSSGYYLFDRAFTQANPLRGDAASGDEFAAFLLGYPAPDRSRVDTLIDPGRQSRYYAIFLQDDFKLHPRVTLNLGLRWDYEQPYTERYNRMVRGFAFTQPSPVAAAVRSSPVLANCPACSELRGGLLFAGSSGQQRFSFLPDKNNFQPRIGVAVQLANKWVLRGGYGLSYLGTLGPQASTGFSVSTPVLASVELGRPRASLDNAFPDGLLRPVGSSQGLSTLLGQDVGFGYLGRVVPYSHQFSFSIERALTQNTLVEIAYSGNQTRQFSGGTGVGGVGAPLNVIPADQLGRPDAFYTERIANPLAGLLPLNPVLNAATVQRQQLLVPFPQYRSVSMGDISIGKNHYHSMQTRLVKRYSQGMTLNISYTISKNIEAISFLNAQDFNLSDAGASRLDRVLSLWDVPQKLAGLWSYELPFGRGKQFAAGLRGPMAKLVSGWQLNVNAIVQSGFPINFPNAPPREARSAKLPNSQRNGFNAFDKSLFPNRVPGPFILRSWSSRFPDVRKYPLENVDFGLTKKTAVTEKATFELRAEFLNATNHPWFSETDSQAHNVTSPRFGWFEQRQRNDPRIIALGGRLTW